MKDPLSRTKVVLRHLPPAISQAALMEQIDGRFAGRYKWARFCPCKNSQKNQRHARAYIDFNTPEDVVEFAEVFDGHIFVNEKGAQFKAVVEYAPSQRAPMACSKKDGREGSILKDPEYLEFLEHLAKPVENLPSAEIQLERREAERAAGPKEMLVVTPLMEFIRQKRAARSGSQRSITNGKVGRRAGGASTSSSGPFPKRGSEKRRVPTQMYVLRESTKNGSVKDKTTNIFGPREVHQLTGKSLSMASASGVETLEDERVPGGTDTGKRRVVLLKGKEKEISVTQRNEGSGRIVKGILTNKDAKQSQLNLSAPQFERQTPAMHIEKDKRPPRPTNARPILKDVIAGSPRLIARRGVTYGSKEVDGSPSFMEGKSSKRGPAGYGSHERQVWVQKSGSAS